MIESDLDRRIAAVRGFSRFYTRSLGILEEGYLRSPFSLTEVRVLYELAHRETPTASELARDLGLDPGYLSRVLRGFKRRGLLDRKTTAGDGRRRLLWLTAKGHETVAPLEARSRELIGGLLGRLTADDQERLVGAAVTIEKLLDAPPSRESMLRLRLPRSGDLGWIVQRHGALYAREYAWDERFEALVAGIVAKFGEGHDPRRERCWIAEIDGDPVGSVFCVRRSATVAQLRLLLVEPRARGRGVGTRLVDECVHFARAAGYRKITLWTNSVLDSARRIYERAGFHLVEEDRHRSFGHDLVGQNWELRLSGRAL